MIMEALFIYLLKSAGILTIFFLAYKVLLQKETFFSLNRHYLLGGIIASLLLPLVVFESYIYVDPVVIPETLFYDTPSTIVESANSAQSTPFDWGALLFNIYLLGVILTSIQFLLQLFSLYRIAKSGTIKRFKSFRLIEVSSNVSPFSFFNYIIYNPENFSKRDLQIILNHEKAHGKQLHSIDILVSQTFLILQWFNPIAWFYKKTIQQNLEFMADKEAISNIESKKNYQHTLLKVSVASYCASITNNFYNSLIKKRIVMLNQKSSKTKNLWKYGMILPALALFLVSFNTKTVEIVKEMEPSLIEPNNEYTHNTSELLIPAVETKSTPMVNPNNVKASIIESVQQNDVIVKITKDTTKEELDKIQKDLREKGMEFSYSKLDYNAAKEIVSIRLKYKDKEFGNSGTYHVNGDDDEPIKPIFIYTKENGGFGIGNSPDDHVYKELLQEHKVRAEEHKERAERIKVEHVVRLEERREHLEERKAKMAEEHEVQIMEMKERQEEMHVEQEVRMKEHKVRAHEREARVHAEQKVRMKEHKVRVHEREARVHEEQKVRLKEQKERMKEQKVRMKEVREERKMRMKDGDSNRFVYRIKTDNKKDDNVFVYRTSSSDNPGKINISAGKNALYIVDGKETKKGHIMTINPNTIASVNVLKGETAITSYGKKGEDGVVQIITKDKKSPWKVSYGTNYVNISDDSSKSKNVWVYEDGDSKLFRINKNTSSETLKSYKTKLKEQGIDVKFTKVKRNSDGEITSIKVSLKNSEGQSSSATWRDNDNTIPAIRIGTRGGKLIASSSL